jgi:hypothetical protein
MKIMLILGALYLGLSFLKADAQVVKDPLLAYYQSSQSDKTDLPSPQLEVYCFEADFTGDGQKSIFITDQGSSLGAHGKYSWSVYCPVASGGYRLVTDGSHFIAAGLKGPDYVGYIDQIKRYGVITGGKDAVVAQYLDNGILQSQAIDQERGHDNADHYPKYFHAHAPDYHITTSTLAQLAQKYAGQ